MHKFLGMDGICAYSIWPNQLYCCRFCDDRGVDEGQKKGDQSQGLVAKIGQTLSHRRIYGLWHSQYRPSG